MFTTNISSSRAYMKFEHQISEGTYHTIVPSTEELYCLNSIRCVGVPDFFCRLDSSQLEDKTL